MVLGADDTSDELGASENEGREPVFTKLVSRAFPDMRCLRCEHNHFGIDPMKEHSGRTFVMIICERCGFVERHLWSYLKVALLNGELPVPSQGTSNAE